MTDLRAALVALEQDLRSLAAGYAVSKPTRPFADDVAEQLTDYADRLAEILPGVTPARGAVQDATPALKDAGARATARPAPAAQQGVEWILAATAPADLRPWVQHTADCGQTLKIITKPCPNCHREHKAFAGTHGQCAFCGKRIVFEDGEILCTCGVDAVLSAPPVDLRPLHALMDHWRLSRHQRDHERADELGAALNVIDALRGTETP